MGGRQSNQSIKPVDMEQWCQLQQEGDCTVLKNKSNGLMAELRSVLLDPKRDIEQEMQIYAYRKYQDHAIVKCYQVLQLHGQPTTLCGNERIMQVISQRIPYRWNQVRQLQFSHALYALIEALRGFQQLYSRAGFFQISPNMLGVNNKGKVRVWLNPNWAANHPSDQMLSLYATKTDQCSQTSRQQSRMVNSIIDLVQGKCQNGKFPEPLLSRIQSESSSFERVRNQISAYLMEQKLQVPTHLQEHIGQVIQTISTGKKDIKANPFTYATPSFSVFQPDPVISGIRYTPAHSNYDEQLIYKSQRSTHYHSRNVSNHIDMSRRGWVAQ